jgi:hypothetical protein
MGDAARSKQTDHALERIGFSRETETNELDAQRSTSQGQGGEGTEVEERVWRIEPTPLCRMMLI